MKIIPAPTIYNKEPVLAVVSSYSDLEKRVARLGQKTILEDQEHADLKKAYQLANRWIWPISSMKRSLSELPVETVKAFLLKLMKEDSREIHRFHAYVLNCLTEEALFDKNH